MPQAPTQADQGRFSSFLMMRQAPDGPSVLVSGSLTMSYCLKFCGRQDSVSRLALVA